MASSAGEAQPEGGMKGDTSLRASSMKLGIFSSYSSSFSFIYNYVTS
jgi:hypothetical protein